jgi:hypothetical protein
MLNDIKFTNDMGRIPLGLALFTQDRSVITIGYGLGGLVLASVTAWPVLILAALALLNDDRWVTEQAGGVKALPAVEALTIAAIVEYPSAPGHSPIVPNIGPGTVAAPSEPIQSRFGSAIDIASALADPIKSSILVGQPGAGKGLTVAYATRAIKQRRPEVSIWVIDPKGDPGEAAYWLACDRVLDEPIPAFPRPEDIEDFQAKADRFVSEFKDVVGPKLLIVDEVLAVKELMPSWFKGLVTACNHLASTGRSRGVYVWLISQTPNASDFGISGGARNVFRRVLLLSADDLGLIDNNSTFFSGRPSDALLKVTGRVFFDSLGGLWGAVPQYPDLAVGGPPSLPIVDEESRHDRLEHIYNNPPAEVVHEQFYGASMTPPPTVDVTPEEAAILDYCRRRNGGTTRQIQQGKLPALSGYDSATIKALCDGLVDDGLGRWDGLIFRTASGG